MAPRLFRPLRNASFLSSSSSTSSSIRNWQLEARHHLSPADIQKSHLGVLQAFRSYISDMRKSAFEGNVLRLLRNEIRYELESSPPKQPLAKFGPFEIDHRPGEQWIRLKREYGCNEDIKIEVTMFDGAVPSTKSVVNGSAEDVNLHITLIINISKEGNSDVLEILCSAWPDSMEINKLFIRRGDQMAAHPYAGPEFKELDDELQDTLYDFLEARGVDDGLASFLHYYMKNKDKTEFIKWMETVKAFIEKKEIS